MKIIHGKVENVLPTLADNSVDCIVTDPPYELGFMGKKWDSSGIAYSVAMWAECLRVLKPGGHLLSFSGSRTYHRMTCAIEDAGFEVRDQIMWIYGSGFPKSMDVSKAIDKAAGVEREVVGINKNARTSTTTDLQKAYLVDRSNSDITIPATPEAIQWQGWGTALKPAHEPICVARKPLIGTVADNVLQYGTGAINIDACRVGSEIMTSGGSLPDIRSNNYENSVGKTRLATEVVEKEGRFPANLIHDGSEEVITLFPSQAGASAPVKGSEKSKASIGNVTGERDRVAGVFHNDKGSAARFFYCAKASKADRGVGNDHPTVKPTTLMQYLAKLVCPPGGVLLDPFAGSGSTLKACELEGIKAVGIDQELHHVKIITSRVSTCVIVVDGIEMDRDTFEMLY